MLDLFSIFKRQQVTLTLRMLLMLDMDALFSGGYITEAVPVITWNEAADGSGAMYYEDYLDTIDGLRTTIRKWRQA